MGGPSAERLKLGISFTRISTAVHAGYRGPFTVDISKGHETSSQVLSVQHSCKLLAGYSRLDSMDQCGLCEKSPSKQLNVQISDDAQIRSNRLPHRLSSGCRLRLHRVSFYIIRLPVGSRDHIVLWDLHIQFAGLLSVERVDSAHMRIHERDVQSHHHYMVEAKAVTVLVRLPMKAEKSRNSQPNRLLHVSGPTVRTAYYSLSSLCLQALILISPYKDAICSPHPSYLSRLSRMSRCPRR